MKPLGGERDWDAWYEIRQEPIKNGVAYDFPILLLAHALIWQCYRANFNCTMMQQQRNQLFTILPEKRIYIIIKI